MRRLLGRCCGLEGRHEDASAIADPSSATSSSARAQTQPPVHYYAVLAQPQYWRADPSTEQQLRHSALLACLQLPLPQPTPPPSRAASARMEGWQALIRRVLSLSVPHLCVQLLPLVPTIAAFLYQPGCFGRLATAISTSGVPDALSGRVRADQLRLTVSTLPSYPTLRSTQQTSTVLAGAYKMWGGSYLPTVDQVSVSAVTGNVYLQWRDTVHVIQPDSTLQRSVCVAAPAAAADWTGTRSVYAAFNQQGVLYARVVQLSDGVERILTVDGTWVMHLWRIDGQLERSMHGLQPLDPTGRLEAVEVSRVDDSLHISRSWDGGLRMHGGVTKSDRTGRLIGLYAALPCRGGAPHALYLLPSPYAAADDGQGTTEWLYSVDGEAVDVCDTTTRQLLFRIGGHAPSGYPRPSPAVLSRAHSDAFARSTVAFHHHGQQTPSVSVDAAVGGECEGGVGVVVRAQPIHSMACDARRRELYLYDRTGGCWLVCDQRGYVRRWWREQRSAIVPTGVEYITYGACFDPVHQRLICCQRPQAHPAPQPCEAIGTLVTISV